MTTNAIISIALAVLCMFSIGVSATTLESSMGTNPDEVIDLDWDALPVGEETAADLNRQIDANQDPQSSEVTGAAAAQADVTQQTRNQGPEGVRQAAQPADEGGGQSRPQAQQAAGATPQTPDRDTGLWLLVALGLIGALLAVGYRYRDRLGLGGGPESHLNDDDPPRWPPGEPTTEIDQAWLDMVGRLDVDRPWARTPAEFGAAAIDAGMDAEPVERVTATFMAVKYGGARVTDRHRERARDALRQLGLRGEVEST